jgi:glycosyltransferase involved in cell wall biosynthesis
VRCPTINELPPPSPGKTGWPWTEESPRLLETTRQGKAWPRVSVITPSYNQGQFIEETIRSVLLQGYPDLEYMIIDGGSTDESPKIIRKYEPWLAYYVSEPDRGQTHAINKGWMRATGAILAYINTDDCYLNGAIATAAHEFCARPDVGMVYGTAIIVDEASKRLRTWKAKPFDLNVMLTAGSIVPQPALFLSKNAVQTVGYLNEKWQTIMDYEYCIRIAMRFPTVCVPGTLARFRDHSQSKSRLLFEVMASELIQFLTSFSTDQVSKNDWRTIKHAAMSRVHYELALAYLAQDQPEGSKALKHLLESISLYPLFSLSRPMITAHIAKEVLIDHFKAIGGQVTDFVKRLSS